MIIAENVSRDFGKFQALKNISFEIKPGEIVGFLGQNGAGKTTLMRILTSYLLPSSGRVIINGKDILKDSLSIRRNIGYLPENPPLYVNMTVRDYLGFAARLKDIYPKDQQFQVDRVVQECDLSTVTDKMIATLSKGYKQRVGIAQAIIHEPQILILDEPTNGLDPIQILQVRKLIKNLEHKRIVIVSTHILSEIEQIAQRVIMIRSGEILVDDFLENLLCNYGPGATLEKVFLKLHNYA